MASLDDQPGKLAAELLFAEGEGSVTLHGYAAVPPRINVGNGRAGEVQYDSGTHYFSVEIKPDAGSPTDSSTGDPVRRVTVTIRAAQQ